MFNKQPSYNTTIIIFFPKLTKWNIQNKLNGRLVIAILCNNQYQHIVADKLFIFIFLVPSAIFCFFVFFSP